MSAPPSVPAPCRRRGRPRLRQHRPELPATRSRQRRPWRSRDVRPIDSARRSTDWVVGRRVPAPGMGTAIFADGVWVVNRKDAGFTGEEPNGEIYRIDRRRARPPRRSNMPGAAFRRRVGRDLARQCRIRPNRHPGRPENTHQADRFGTSRPRTRFPRPSPSRRVAGGEQPRRNGRRGRSETWPSPGRSGSPSPEGSVFAGRRRPTEPASGSASPGQARSCASTPKCNGGLADPAAAGASPEIARRLRADRRVRSGTARRRRRSALCEQHRRDRYLDRWQRADGVRPRRGRPRRDGHRAGRWRRSLGALTGPARLLRIDAATSDLIGILTLDLGKTSSDPRGPCRPGRRGRLGMVRVPDAVVEVRPR